MKVLVIGPQFPDSFARNIVVTLKRMGHEVTSVRGTRTRHHGGRLSNVFWGNLPKAFPTLERKSFSDVLRTAQSVQPALVLVTYGLMPPEVVSDLKAVCDGKIVCWYTDSIMNPHRHYVAASPYDAIFMKEPFMVRVLRDKLGQNAFYLPECCNSAWHRRADLTDDDRRSYGCDLAAQGGLHYYRARMLETFKDYDMKIWGRNRPPWLTSPVKKYYTNHFVAEYEKAKAFQAAKIVINTVHYSEIEGVNCTLFEVAGCGAFQIADWKPALPELFEPDKEIVTFQTGAELKEKVDYYLAHPRERQEIADRTYTRAHRDHIYEKRLEKMFEILGFTSAAPGRRELASLRTA